MFFAENELLVWQNLFACTFMPTSKHLRGLGPILKIDATEENPRLKRHVIILDI